MTNAQRAMQFWSVLVQAARTQQVLSYDMMAKMTGLPRWTMTRPLGKILAYCQQNELPLLTSIVLEQSTGNPLTPLLTYLRWTLLRSIAGSSFSTGSETAAPH